MKLSRTGQHVVGGVDLYVHIDRAIPPALDGVRASGWAFCTDDLVMGPGQWPGETAWTLLGYARASGELHRIDLTPDAANWFGAGNGVWAAGNPQYVYGSHLPTGRVPGAGLYTVGRDGIVVVKPDYQADAGIALYDPSGATTALPGAVYVAYNDGLLLYHEAGALTLLDRPSGTEIPAVSVGLTFCLCRGADGAGYLCEWQEAQQRTVLHRADTSSGWVVAHGGHDFHADVCTVADSGQLRVSSAYGQGERVHEVNDYRIDPASATIDLLAPAMPIIGRPAFWAPFEFARPSRA